MVAVRVTDPDEAEILGYSLAAAYAENPLVKWMFADDLSESRLRSLFEALVITGVRQGVVYRSPESDGVAIWLPPVQHQGDPSDAPPAAVGEEAEWSGGRRKEALSILSKARPNHQHYYLDAVGVIPEARRRGVASKLLAPVLEQCDQDGIPAYLENSDPANLDYYKGQGFVDIGVLPMPRACPPVIAMRRDPLIRGPQPSPVGSA